MVIKKLSCNNHNDAQGKNEGGLCRCYISLFAEISISLVCLLLNIYTGAIQKTPANTLLANKEQNEAKIVYSNKAKRVKR